LHRASQSFLHIETHNFRKKWRPLAIKYWTGVRQGAQEEEEMLFEGLVEVTEEVYIDTYCPKVTGLI